MRTRGADRFTTELTAEMGPTDLTATVLSTAGSPPSPCLLVIEHDVSAQAEIILFDDTFTGTTFVTTALANRYQAGSAAGSGLTHPVGSNVIFAALGAHHEEIHDELEAHEAASAVHGAVAAATADTLMLRDANARAQVADPSLGPDIATKAYVDSVVPVGIIAKWSGSIGSIPSRWQLCDGTNGTPDLRGRFIIGAGGSYNPDDTGGASTHVHTQTGHTHAISSDGYHDHGGDTGTPDGTLPRAAGTGSTAGPTHKHGISGGGSHDHGGSTGSGGGGINTASASSLPPYYALAFIQRVT